MLRLLQSGMNDLIFLIIIIEYISFPANFTFIIFTI